MATQKRNQQDSSKDEDPFSSSIDASPSKRLKENGVDEGAGVVGSFDAHHDPSMTMGTNHRDNHFTKQTWWMVDLSRSPSQGATPLVKRCIREHQWSPEYAKRVLVAYEQFLTIKKEKKDWDAKILSPCHAVDLMWHQHILDLKNYVHDCQLLCGHMVWHDPDGALNVAAKLERDRGTQLTLRQRFADKFDEALWTGRYGSSSPEQRSAPSHPPRVQSSNDANATISLRIRDHAGKEMHFKISMTTVLGRVFETYAQIKGVHSNALRFKYDGEQVAPDQTPEILGLSDQDWIDVFLEQTGC